MPGIQAIAHSQSMLEVLPVSKKSAVPFITAVLPTYTSTGHYASKDAISKEQLFANLPLSDIECEQGWNELCCFELEESRHSVVPSASITLQAWTSMLNTATAFCIDLCQPLTKIDQATLIGVDNDWPDELPQALLRSMTTSRDETDGMQLDGSKCAQQIGRSLLKDYKEKSNGTIACDEFKTQWADLLPENWREHAGLELLRGSSKMDNDGRDISFVSQSAGNGATTEGTAAAADSKSTLGAKRKWHDKFRASKKTT